MSVLHLVSENLVSKENRTNDGHSNDKCLEHVGNFEDLQNLLRKTF